MIVQYYIYLQCTLFFLFNYLITFLIIQTFSKSKYNKKNLYLLMLHINIPNPIHLLLVEFNKKNVNFHNDPNISSKDEYIRNKRIQSINPQHNWYSPSATSTTNSPRLELIRLSSLPLRFPRGYRLPTLGHNCAKVAISVTRYPEGFLTNNSQRNRGKFPFFFHSHSLLQPAKA